MDEELKKILMQIIEGQQALDLKVTKLKNKIDAKIENEVSDKLNVLVEEQSIIRRDILDIKYQQQANKQISLDIKLSVDALNSNQRKQENKIIELDNKLAK
ncbi:MAG: hypothetical protein K0R09_1806 [Clostridiales bacterium]|jgi:hypothetical protein|nr:hypothetical protein [Clostridiales bacterium]